MRKFIHVYLLLLFLLLSGYVNAQKVLSTSQVNNKKYIVLRPNSRDYGPNLRDNSYHRTENKKDGNLYIRKRPVTPQNINQLNNSNLKNNQNLQRRQINVFHRPL